MNKVLYLSVLAVAICFSGLSTAQDVTIDTNKDSAFFAAGFNEGVPSFTVNNFGAHTHAPVGQANSDRVNRGIFQFDIAGNVPSGATITAASFNFEVTQQGGPQGMASVDFSVHRVTTAWDEGSGTMNIGEATGDGVTWANATAATTWTTLGGDFDAATSGTVLVNGGGNYSASSSKLIDDIQAIVDGTATDNGFLLKADPEGVGGTAARVTTREGGTPANLMISYTTGGDCLIGDVNLDGAVNLLDVAPFVNLISTGTFQKEADINEDDSVNLLDVQPFVNLLSGG